MNQDALGWYLRKGDGTADGPFSTEEMVHGIIKERWSRDTVCRRADQELCGRLDDKTAFSECYQVIDERINVVCECGNRMELASKFEGRQAKCAACQRQFMIHRETDALSNSVPPFVARLIVGLILLATLITVWIVQSRHQASEKENRLASNTLSVPGIEDHGQSGNSDSLSSEEGLSSLRTRPEAPVATDKSEDIGSVSSQAHARTAVDRTSPIFAPSAPERKLEFAQWITGVAQPLSLPVFNDEQAAQKWRVDADWYLSALQRATPAARKATKGTPVQLKARDEITAGLAGCGRILGAIYLVEGARPSGIDMWADLAPVFLSDDPETQKKYMKKAQVNTLERIAAGIALDQLYADFRKTYEHLYLNVCESASTEIVMPHADSEEVGGVEMDLDCLRFSSFPKYDSIKYTYTGTEPLRRAWIVMGFVGDGNSIVRNVQYVGGWSPGQSRWARYPRSGGGVVPKATLRGAVNLVFTFLVTDTSSHVAQQTYAGKERERDLARALPRLRVEAKATQSRGLRLMLHGVRHIGGVVIQAETRHQGKVRTFNWTMGGWLATRNWWIDSRFFGSPDWKFPRPNDPTSTIPDQVVIRIWPLDSAVGVEFAPWKASVAKSGLGEPKIVRR